MASNERAHPRWLLIALLGGMALGNVDIAIANTAAPSIRSGLHASGGELELIVSGYTLAYAVLLITGARLGDMRGYRRMYLFGLGVFTLASLACGLAPTAFTLALARIIQGGAAAVLAAQVLTGIQVNFEGPARERALGRYAAVLAGSAVVGQIFGGVLISADVFGTTWRPVFLINVPLGVLLIAVAARVLPSDQSPRPHRLDLAGVTTLSAALLLLVVPLVLGREQDWPPWTWASLTASVPAFALFVAVERRLTARGGYPVLNLRLLARPTVSRVLLSQAAAASTYFALLFVIALYLQQGLGHSPAYSGLVMVSWVAAFGVAGPVLARISERGKRLAAPAGSLVLAAGFAGIATSALAGVTNGALLMALLGVSGLGFGAAFSGVLGHLTRTAPSRYAADVSGLFNTLSRLGGVVGVAVFGTAYLSFAPSPPVHGFAAVTVGFAATALGAAALAYVGPPSGRRSRRIDDAAHETQVEEILRAQP